jgi:arylformamidase
VTEIIDISRPIDADAVVYPGDPSPETVKLCEPGADAPCNITALNGWTTHFLTHVDPPRHFIPDGDTLDDIPLGRFIGRTVVVEAQGDAVLASDIPAGRNLEGLNLLFRTRNSADEFVAFNEDHVYVSAEAAEVAVERGVNLVGIDYIGIDRYGDESYPVHNALLSAGVLILEGLDLSAAEPGDYTLIALPLSIAGGDGSPVRAVLTHAQD